MSKKRVMTDLCSSLFFSSFSYVGYTRSNPQPSLIKSVFNTASDVFGAFSLTLLFVSAGSSVRLHR